MMSLRGHQGSRPLGPRDVSVCVLETKGEWRQETGLDGQEPSSTGRRRLQGEAGGGLTGWD